MKVTESLISEVQQLNRRLINNEFINSSYYEYKKETTKFQKFVNKKLEKMSKDGTSDKLSNK